MTLEDIRWILSVERTDRQSAPNRGAREVDEPINKCGSQSRSCDITYAIGSQSQFQGLGILRFAAHAPRFRPEGRAGAKQKAIRIDGLEEALGAAFAPCPL